MAQRTVHVLDYGAGNVRSLYNAIVRAGFTPVAVTNPADVASARVLVFPGVGSFGSAMEFLEKNGYRDVLCNYIAANRPYLGICLGMQTLFEGSEEAVGCSGLSVIPGMVTRFQSSDIYSVPHIGWNGVTFHQSPEGLGIESGSKVYFVHSYRACPSEHNAAWVLATTDYAGFPYISAVRRGNVMATQFHPEKSGSHGLLFITNFLKSCFLMTPDPVISRELHITSPTLKTILEGAKRAPTCLSRRIIACLDVRTNDEGELVVTKGDQYDVREHSQSAGNSSNRKAAVRALGDPEDMAARYYDEGADEIAFLNITAFRSETLADAPMLKVLQSTSENVFVPLTIGGGIRSYMDSAGNRYSAVDVANAYFRAGADKISIGSDAVYAAEQYYQNGSVRSGTSSIEEIAGLYGSQAVVVSIDPRRVYVLPEEIESALAAGHTLLEADPMGPKGETRCWYQCTVKGGREGRPLCAQRLAKAVEALGAGELLVNCVDADGQKAGFDEMLLKSICSIVRIPVVASSGAGAPSHFSSVFAHTRCEAALAAGIFHRREVTISEVKLCLAESGIEVRI